MATPFTQAEVDIIYGQGISRETDLLTLGIVTPEKKPLVEKNGSWYSYNGERLAQGEDGARRFLLTHQEIAGKLESELRAVLFPKR